MSLNCKISRFLAVKSEINNRRLKLDKSIVTGKFVLPFLTTLALFSPSSAWGFTLNGSNGKIEFSVRPVELPSSNRKYDPTTTSTSVKDGLLTPGEGYPEISLEPNPPIETKQGSLTLSDIWDDPRGSANIKVQTVTRPTVAEIVWNGTGVFLNDLVADQSAARNASFGSAEFITTTSGIYTEYAFLNVEAKIDTTQEDAWVVGSLIAHFDGAAAARHTLEILFGFDGNNSRKDFIKAYLDGQLNPSTFSSYLAISEAGTFNAKALVTIGDFFTLNQGQKLTIEGTFSCVGFNGSCTSQEMNFSPSDPESVPEAVPEPSSMLGLLTFGIMARTAKLLKHLPRKR